jgi:CubicO group peptidase (beta-lactamase class C family)
MRALLLLICLSLLSVAPATATGLAPAAQQALDALLEGARASHSDSFLVRRGERLLAEHYSKNGREPIETMSVTKSVVALGIGRLLTLGKLASLELPLHGWFPEWKQGRKQAITLRMLLEQTSGLQNLPNTGVEIYPAPDVIRLALAAELSHPPGERYAYNNKAVNLLAAVIASACGESMEVCLGRELLQPLGIEPGPWFKDAAGNPHAMAGLPLRAEDLAKIGQLVLQRGVWQGQTLIDPSFIEAMLAASPRSDEAGMLWWRRPAWTRFHADADSIAMLERLGLRAELLEPLRALQGRRFEHPSALAAALAEVLGPQWAERWRDALTVPHGVGPWRPFHPEQGPVEQFSAEGYLGQYLIVIPKAELVVVRQIAARDPMPEDSSYSDISARAQRLADALVQ